MTDLLPCPFCGGTLFAFSEDERQVRCAECNACGPEPIMVCSDTPDGLRRAVAKAAIDLWNRRATIEPTVIEAGALQIGETSGWHVVIDGSGQRIYDGDTQIYP